MIKLTMTFYDSLGFDFSVHQCNLFGKCSRIALFISNRHTLNLQKLERFNFKYDLNSFFIIHKGFFNEWMYSIQSMNVLQLNKILKFFGGGGGILHGPIHHQQTDWINDYWADDNCFRLVGSTSCPLAVVN